MRNSLINHSVLEEFITEQIRVQTAPLYARIDALEKSLNNTEYLSKQEAADYIGCCTSTIDNYVRRGLRKYKLSKGKVVFKREDIDAFLREKLI